MQRDTLFISHATPEDNEFSIWLASRLEMMGYKVWLDKNYLLGGEHMWQDIQEQIQNHAIKILFVYSSHINDDKGFLKEGIQKELYYAESISKQKSLKNFIIPLNIDPKAEFNEFIGSNMLTQILFYNWAEGLEQLLRKLNQENVPFSKEIKDSSLGNWYENQYISKCTIENKQQNYYSSLWEIKTLPPYFYIYKFYNEKSAEVVFNANGKSIIVRQAKLLITFDEKLFIPFNNSALYQIQYEIKYRIPTSEVTENDNTTYPTYIDCNNALKALLNTCLRKFFISKGLISYGLSGRKNAYYYSKDSSNVKIKFNYPIQLNGKDISKSKVLLGIFDNNKYWHYGISYKACFSPVFGFSLKSHIIFTSDGKTGLFDINKQHSYRRKKGKRFFNEEWRDLLLAFIASLKEDDKGGIFIPVSSNNFIELETFSSIFSCNFDYTDPCKEMTSESVESYYEENELDE